jgi:hypothetical protein
MIFFYKFIDDLPSVPREIIDNINFNRVPTGRDKDRLGAYKPRKLINWYGRSFDAMVNNRVDNCPEFNLWVKEHVIDNFRDAGINYVIYNRDDGLESSTGGHTDCTRNFALIYNIRTGGDHAMTCFWQEHGKPVYRERCLNAEDMNQLTLLDQVFVPENRWIIIDTRILHSVEHLVESRISFQVSLDEHPW